MSIQTTIFKNALITQLKKSFPDCASVHVNFINNRKSFRFSDGKIEVTEISENDINPSNLSLAKSFFGMERIDAVDINMIEYTLVAYGTINGQKIAKRF